jgi:hypothetical protein
MYTTNISNQALSMYVYEQLSCMYLHIDEIHTDSKNMYVHSPSHRYRKYSVRECDIKLDLKGQTNPM